MHATYGLRIHVTFTCPTGHSLCSGSAQRTSSHHGVFGACRCGKDIALATVEKKCIFLKSKLPGSMLLDQRQESHRVMFG